MMFFLLPIERFPWAMWKQVSLSVVNVCLCEICTCGWGQGQEGEPSDCCSHCVAWLRPHWHSSASLTCPALSLLLKTCPIANKNKILTWVRLGQTCNPRYSERWGKRITSSRLAWATERAQGMTGKPKEILISNFKKMKKTWGNLRQITFLPCLRPQSWRVYFEVN